jgi:predicted transcriptional regulator
MSTLTIRIDAQLEATLDVLAKTQGRTKSEVARDMLRRHIVLRKFHELRGKIQPLAQAAGYFTDDNVLRDLS